MNGGMMIHQDEFEEYDNRICDGLEYEEISIPDNVLYKMEEDYDWPDPKASYLDTSLITSYISIYDKVRARFPTLYKLSNHQLDLLWEWLWLIQK